jgi:hypothetical protein
VAGTHRGSTPRGLGHTHRHRTTIKALAGEGTHRTKVKYVSPLHPAKVAVAKVKAAKKAKKAKVVKVKKARAVKGTKLRKF